MLVELTDAVCILPGGAWAQPAQRPLHRKPAPAVPKIAAERSRFHRPNGAFFARERAWIIINRESAGEREL